MGYPINDPSVFRYFIGMNAGQILTPKGLRTVSSLNVKADVLEQYLAELAKEGILGKTPDGRWKYLGGIERMVPNEYRRTVPEMFLDDPVPPPRYVTPSKPFVQEAHPPDVSATHIQPVNTNTRPPVCLDPTKDVHTVQGSSISIGHRDPLYKIAQELFDQNPNVYLARVVSVNKNMGSRRVASAEILTPDGISDGVIAAQWISDRTLYRIIGEMQPEQFVLVRRASPVNLSTTLNTELILAIKPEHNVTKDGKQIVTLVEDKRILNLLIAGQSVKHGVPSGVGYLENDSLYHPQKPVFVAGGEGNVMVPEASIVFSGGNFVLAETPMTQEQRADRDLRKLRYCVSAGNGMLDALKISGVEGEHYDPEDHRTKIDGAERLYIRSLGIMGRSPPAMHSEAEKAVDDARHFISRIAAVHGMSRREESVIKGFYPHGSADYEQLMHEMPALIDTQLAKEAESMKPYGYTNGEIQGRMRDVRSRMLIDPFAQTGSLRLFFPYRLEHAAHWNDNPDYIAAAGRALVAAANDFHVLYDWRARFSLESAESAAAELIDEQLFWDAVARGFHGVDIEGMWGRIVKSRSGFYGEVNAAEQRIMEPYIEKLKRVSARSLR